MGTGKGGNFGKTKGNLKQSKSKKDARFYGNPGEKKQTGYKETYIGKDGRANREVHHTDHGNPKRHSNPHEHIIHWDSNGNPIFDKNN